MRRKNLTSWRRYSMDVKWLWKLLEDGNVAARTAFRRGQFDKNQSFVGAVFGVVSVL